MTWLVNQRKPVILFPNLAAMNYDWSIESAFVSPLTPPAWNAETGTPARDTTYSLFGAGAAKLVTAGVDQTMLNRFTYDTTIWLAKDGGIYSAYAWVYPTAFTGEAYVSMNLRLTKAAGVALTTPSSTTVNFANALLTLNAWNLIRISAPALTTTQQGEFASVDLRIGLVPNTGTGTIWVDGCWCGRALDFQDLGPYATGAQVEHAFDYEKYFTFLNKNCPSGKFQHRRANAGFLSGSLKSTPFNAAGVVAWEAFMDYCMAGSAVTILYSQADQTRDLIMKAVIQSDDTGVDMVNGMDTSTGMFKWQEVA